MYRHGDVLICKVEQIPDGASRLSSNIILEGTSTGHAHRLIDGGLHDKDGTIYLSVDEIGQLVHEEHNTIELPAGNYAMTRQQEFDPYEEAARYVQD